MCQGLAEIAGLFLDTPARRDVEYAADPDGAIERETLGCPTGTREFCLEHIVREDHRLVEVAEEITDGVLARVWDNVVIDLGERLDQPLIEEHVESENMPVQRLKRIIIRLELGARGRIGRRSGASAYRYKRYKRDKHFFYGICEVHGGGQVLSVY